MSFFLLFPAGPFVVYWQVVSPQVSRVLLFIRVSFSVSLFIKFLSFPLKKKKKKSRLGNNYCGAHCHGKIGLTKSKPQPKICDTVTQNIPPATIELSHKFLRTLGYNLSLGKWDYENWRDLKSLIGSLPMEIKYRKTSILNFLLRNLFLARFYLQRRT